MATWRARFTTAALVVTGLALLLPEDAARRVGPRARRVAQAAVVVWVVLGIAGHHRTRELEYRIERLCEVEFVAAVPSQPMRMVFPEWCP